MDTEIILWIVIGVALAFDFTNGFHDTANSMAATIATGALRPKAAVTLAAVLNVFGAFISLAVAATIAKGIVDQGAVTLPIIFGGLVGAIAWNLVTWYYGLPSSSSHALIGGVVGATAMVAGLNAVNGQGLVSKVMIPAVISPVLAALIAYGATRIARRATDRQDVKAVGRGYRYGQVASSSLLSLAHGTNDAQKTMGVIALALVAHGSLAEGADPPMWVILAAALAIGLGTWFGGWRIIHTLGSKITDLRPVQGFTANTASACVLLSATSAGFPLSTTHAATGGVIGAGAGHGFSSVRWSLAGRMVAGWALTLPGAALVGGLAAWVAQDGIGGDAGVIVVAAGVIVLSAVLWFLSRSDRVSHHDLEVGEFAMAREVVTPPAAAAPSTPIAV